MSFYLHGLSSLATKKFGEIISNRWQNTPLIETSANPNSLADILVYVDHQKVTSIPAYQLYVLNLGGRNLSVLKRTIEKTFGKWSVVLQK